MSILVPNSSLLVNIYSIPAILSLHLWAMEEAAVYTNLHSYNCKSFYLKNVGMRVPNMKQTRYSRFMKVMMIP